MVYEPLFNSKQTYEFKTPALRRLNTRLIHLDNMYYIDHFFGDKKLVFPLLDRIRMALLIIVGP